MTGVGLAAGLLNLVGPGSASTTYVCLAVLLAGLALLVVGRRGRGPNRR